MEKRYHCGHCNEKVSRTLYFQHKKLYYSASEKTWKTGGEEGEKESKKVDFLKIVMKVYKREGSGDISVQYLFCCKVLSHISNVATAQSVN